VNQFVIDNSGYTVRAKVLVKSFDYHTDKFNENEKKFLDRWLVEYVELELGRSPTRDLERKIVKILNNELPFDTPGIEYYLKWRSGADFGNDQIETMTANSTVPVGNDVEAAETEQIRSDHRVRNETNTASRFDDMCDVLSRLKRHAASLSSRQRSDASMWLAAALSTDFSKSIDRLTEWITESAPTVYDRAADAIYNATHEGGKFHRIIDGSHSPVAMWEKVREALPDDTFIQEVTGYADALMKDLSTTQGIPIVSISRESYDAIANSVNTAFGIPRSWTADALTVNTSELLASSLGVVALALNWNAADKERFFEAIGSAGIAATCSANPVLALVTMVSFAKAFNESRDRQSYGEFLRGLSKGGLGTGVLLAASSVIGGPAWIGLIVGLCLAIASRQAIDKIEFSEVASWLVNTLRTEISRIRSS
jgi:hypothetical protein